MDQIELTVTRRDVLGKKVRFLRRKGSTPVHIYGHGVESLALQTETPKLLMVLAQAGQTRLVSLKLDEEAPRMAIVREIQRDPVKGGVLHVDFYQLAMAEKVKMDIPILLVGEAPALKVSKDHTLTQELDSLAIECLPAKIPASIEVDVSPLTDPEQLIRVKDIKLDPDIAVLDDPDRVVARISLRRVEKEEVPAPAAEVVEAVEAEGEAPAEEKEKPKGGEKAEKTEEK